MKYFYMLFVLLVSTVVNAGYGPVFVPQNYVLQKTQGGISIYKHNTQNTFVMLVDVASSEFDFSSTMGSAGVNSDGFNLYHTGDILEQWNLNSTKLATPVFMVNGSFFAYTPTAILLGKTYLSFPVKGNYRTLNNKVADSSEPVRNLVINSSGKAYFNDGFNLSLFNSSTTKEMMTGLIPNLKKDPNSSIGRNYIGGLPSVGCLPDSTTQNCSMDYLVFFVSFSSTHANMLTQMNDWRIPNKSRIMMDGSGSTQLFISAGFKYFNKVDGRKFPNAILVGNK